MDERQFQNALKKLLETVSVNGYCDTANWDGTYSVNSVETYAEAGVLSNNKGLVVGISDRKGTRFQVTIVKA
jgi:hypothetical protein